VEAPHTDLMRPSFFTSEQRFFADRTWIVAVLIRGDRFGAAGFQSNSMDDIGHALGHDFNSYCGRFDAE